MLAVRCLVVRDKALHLCRLFSSSHIMENIHEKTKSGFMDGDYYEKNRPSYTDEVVQVIASIIQGETTPEKKHPYTFDCVEVGSGTGKFTQKILPVLKGARYLATEPMPGFLDALKKKCGEVETLECSADKLPIPDQSVKTIVAAQCFHWFATESALTEFHRCLIPGGHLVMVWNHKIKTDPWIRELDEVLTQYYDDTPRALNYTWLKVIEAFPGFTCKRHSKLKGVHWQGSKDDIVNHFGSISVISSLDEVRKPVVLNQFSEILNKYILQDSSEIHLPFETELYVCNKI